MVIVAHLNAVIAFHAIRFVVICYHAATVAMGFTAKACNLKLLAALFNALLKIISLVFHVYLAFQAAIIVPKLVMVNV